MASVSKQIRTALSHLQKLSIGQLLLVIISVLLVAGGGTGQLIVLNLWVDSFPAPPGGSGSGSGEGAVTNGSMSSFDSMSSMATGTANSSDGGLLSISSGSSSEAGPAAPGVPRINPPFTILTLGAMTQALVYMSFFGIYTLIKSPRLSFLCTCKSVYLSATIGFTVALNGVLLVCATGNTPELLQAFLLSTIVLWTFLFVKVIFAEKRSYISPLVVLSFAFSLGGVVVGSAGSFKASHMDKNTVYWSLIFAGGMIPGALNAVLSSKYMRNFEEPAGFAVPNAEESGALLGAQETEDLEVAKRTTDADTSKYAMLCFGNLWQSFWMFLLMPLGALPWFGVSKSFDDMIEGVGNGYKCTFNGFEGCDDVWKYFLLFNLSFVCSNVGSMFLNYYSPAVNSMVSQLSSPLGAVVLLIAPSWNPHKHKGKKDLGFNIAAIFLLVIGSVVYTAWEESTRNKNSGKPTSSRSFTTDDEGEHEGEEGERSGYGTQYDSKHV